MAAARGGGERVLVRTARAAAAGLGVAEVGGTGGASMAGICPRTDGLLGTEKKGGRTFVSAAFAPACSVSLAPPALDAVGFA